MRGVQLLRKERYGTIHTGIRTLKKHGANSEHRSVRVHDELFREIGMCKLRSFAKALLDFGEQITVSIFKDYNIMSFAANGEIVERACQRCRIFDVISVEVYKTEK